jgi:ABC-type uncharacterized transport system involved in gliding motility auxiliary subunit
MTKKQAAVITALSIAAFILALLVSGRLWFRLDLTKNKSYTISKISRNIRADIPDRVNITYYVSDKLKTIIPAPGEIEDTLREYAAYSKGKIRVTVRDPVKEKLTEAVEGLGLFPIEYPVVEQGETSIFIIYSGIVIEYLDKAEVIPWIVSTSTLEYDLTSRIRSMVIDTERRIGIIAGDSFRQWNRDFGYLHQTLVSAGYRVRLIAPGDEIPDTLPAIFVLGGVEDMDDRALYRIDRYIQQGGKVLFAVKGIYVDIINSTIEARRQKDLGLLDMISSYGVIIRPELALDRNALVWQYQTRTPNGLLQTRYVRYWFWIGVSADNRNTEHPVTVRFSGLELFWASPLELSPPALVSAEPLFTSTDEAWVMKDTFYTNPETAYYFEKDAAETRGKKILGASLSGQFPSFFRGAQKPVREDFEEELPDMPRQASPSRIIVIGDTDFATNIISSRSPNPDFLLSAADWLVNDDDIISIRNRKPQTGRLDKILDTGKRASAMYFSQFVNVALIPLLVIAAGLVISSRRKARSKNAELKAAKDGTDGI